MSKDYNLPAIRLVVGVDLKVSGFSFTSVFPTDVVPDRSHQVFGVFLGSSLYHEETRISAIIKA